MKCRTCISLYLKDYTGQIETSIYQSQNAMPMLLIHNNFWTFPLVTRSFLLRQYRTKISLKFQSCVQLRQNNGQISWFLIITLHFETFLVPGWRKPHGPAKISSRSTSSTKANFWQLPGRFWTPVQPTLMIYTLESVDQWFGKPRKDDDASIPMNCGKKMDHFHQKSLFL